MANVGSDETVIVTFVGVNSSLSTEDSKAAQSKYSDSALSDGALQTSCAEAVPAISKSEGANFDFLVKNFWPVGKLEAKWTDGIPSKPPAGPHMEAVVLGTFVLKENLVKDPQLIIPNRAETVKTNPEKLVVFLKKKDQDAPNTKLAEKFAEVKAAAQGIASVQGFLLYKKELPKTNEGKEDPFFDFAVEVFVDANGLAEIKPVLQQLHENRSDEVTVYYGAFRDFSYNPSA